MNIAEELHRVEMEYLNGVREIMDRVYEPMAKKWKKENPKELKKIRDRIKRKVARK